ncbi:MAG TPA: NmrA/HSCARG family protein [Acidobacteriota bacterium]
MQSRPTIVVCGATGRQGGALVRALLAADRWQVIGLSRSSSGDTVRVLKENGVTITNADLFDKQSLERAFSRAHGVFGVTQPWSTDYKKCDTEGEVRQGKNIIDACRDASVKHLVISTVMHFDEGKTGIPHVDSKLEIEEYADRSGIPYALLKPASFMDNIGSSFFPVKKGKIRGFVDADAKVPYVCCRDIGEVVARLFAEVAPAIGRKINLVSDFVAGNELCEIISRLRNGRRFRYRAVPKLLMRLFAKEFYVMRKAFESWGRPPYRKEILESIDFCRKQYPFLWTVEQYLKARGVDTKELN